LTEKGPGLRLNDQDVMGTRISHAGTTLAIHTPTYEDAI
jgi:hypothetical protein